MSHPARLSLRAPPHLPFIQGWPGIPESSSRHPSAVNGALELRVGANSLKAKWVRVELRKYESLPPGFPTSSQGETWEHVGAINTVWSAPQGKEWDTLEQGDFKFSLPLPVDIPPSVEMMKNTGVRYELVAALCYRQKGGVFKKEASPIMKVSEDIRIVKHELHSAWPMYNVPDTKSGSVNETTLTVGRPSTAFGPGDRILLTATLTSARAAPFQLKGFDCQLIEVITSIPTVDPKGKAKRNRASTQPFSKTRVVASARAAISESMGRGGEKSARMDMVAPSAEKLLVTLNKARTLKVEYRMEVKAVCSGVPEIKLGGIIYTVGPFSRPHAQQAVNDIGYVEALCPGGPPGQSPRPSPGLQSSSTHSSRPTGNLTTSTPSSRPTSSGQPSYNYSPSPQPAYPPGTGPAQSQYFPQSIPPQRYGDGTRAVSQPNPSLPPKGFTPADNFRRKSSNTSSETTTTTTTHGPPSRYSTMVGHGGNLAFPAPAPSAYTPLKNDATPTSSPLLSSNSHERSSDASHDDRSKRYSTATSATFGRWDKDLRTAISTGESPSDSPNASGAAPQGTPTPAARNVAGPSNPSPPRQRGAVPSAWPSAEQEKTKLYDNARNRAIVSQSASGASLNDIGMDGPPPEYEFPPPGDPHYVPLQAEGGKPADGKGLGADLNRSMSTNTGLDTVYTAPESPERSTVAGASSGPSPSGPSRQEASLGVGAGPSKTAYMSAAEEKEAQRKRFEETQNRVVSSSSRNSYLTAQASPDKPTFAAASASGSTSGQTPNATAGSSSGPSVTGGPPSQNLPKSMSGLSEKEQMRRFYEAQDRVNRTRDRSASPTKSVESHLPDMPGSWGGTPVQEVSGGMRKSTSVLSGISEKEQMRRFYEAQDRVARNAGGSSGAGTSSGPLTQQRSRSASPNKPNGFTGSPSVPLSAADEKAQMKRYYEAQDRVARAASGSPQPSSESHDRHSTHAGPSGTARYVPGSPQTPTPSNLPPGAAAPKRISSESGRAESGIGLGIANGGSNVSTNTSATYMTAAEEKEMMRRRFESAQEAVNKRMSTPPRQSTAQLGPGGSGVGPDSGFGSAAAALDSTGSRRRSISPNPSPLANSSPVVADQVPADIPPQRAASNGSGIGGTGGGGGAMGYSTISPLAKEVIARSRQHTARQSSIDRMPKAPDGPPPPLPTKPPMDYINLLSPVDESPTGTGTGKAFSFARWGSPNGPPLSDGRSPEGRQSSQHSPDRPYGYGYGPAIGMNGSGGAAAPGSNNIAAGSNNIAAGSGLQKTDAPPVTLGKTVDEADGPPVPLKDAKDL